MFTFDTELIKNWVETRIDDDIFGTGLRAIGQLDNDGNIVAGVVFSGFNGAQVFLSLACDKPMNRKFIAMMFDYPFNRAGVNRITAFIKSTNLKSINIALRHGFVLESTMEQATLDADMLVFRLFKNECRFLDGKYKKSIGG